MDINNQNQNMIVQKIDEENAYVYLNGKMVENENGRFFYGVGTYDEVKKLDGYEQDETVTDITFVMSFDECMNMNLQMMPEGFDFDEAATVTKEMLESEDFNGSVSEYMAKKMSEDELPTDYVVHSKMPNQDN